MAFSYVTADDVAPLIKGGLSEAQIAMLTKRLEGLSAQLSGRLPGLRAAYLEDKQEIADASEAGEEIYSDLVDLTEAMVTEAGRRFIANPDAMSSETIGVFAYSRFDSADPSKDPFDAADLAALRAMLDEAQQEQVGSFDYGLSKTGYPAAPMPTPWTYSNSPRFSDWRR